jgi:hypothetical protein
MELPPAPKRRCQTYIPKYLFFQRLFRHCKLFAWPLWFILSLQQRSLYRTTQLHELLCHERRRDLYATRCDIWDCVSYCGSDLVLDMSHIGSRIGPQSLQLFQKVPRGLLVWIADSGSKDFPKYICSDFRWPRTGVDQSAELFIGSPLVIGVLG